VARRVSRRRKKRVDENALTCEELRFPGEKRIYMEGVWGVVGAFVIIAYNVMYFMVGPPINNNIQPDAPLYGKWWWPVIILVYPALCWLVANWLTSRTFRRRVKDAGPSARVLNKSHPKLKAVLGEQARLLGIPEPEMYVIPNDLPFIYSMPGKSGAIVASDTLMRVMSDDEVTALVAREMGHIACGHPRMALLAQYMRRVNPVLKVVLFPITAMVMVLKNWLDLIEVTADRVSILVTGRPALLNETLVKLSVTADTEAEISPAELDAFLESATDMSTDAAQIERHYKMGEFLGRHKALRDRIEEIREYPKSDEGQEAMQKMAEMKQKLG